MVVLVDRITPILAGENMMAMWGPTRAHHGHNGQLLMAASD